MLKRMSKTNTQWALSWCALIVLVVLLWQPFRAQMIDKPDGPPWIYGNPEARFTVALYADLECPHCQEYLPQLQRWVVTNDHVNLAWHHLPLPQHEPAASREAALAECMGQLEGREAFWGALVWVFLHTQGNDLGLPSGTKYPKSSPALQACLDGQEIAQVVQAHKRDAQRYGLNVTPALRLIDNHSQRELTLRGTVEPDALLSAIDLLVPPDSPNTEMPADVVSDMPR
ncbi:DsbA family protein [Pseudomonas sp. RW10S2]|uniref:DsbA family protein n=1 Tax=Pseudomonas sp. RW10S2 TaxID=459637 RepID=UPI001645AB41|nr:DsbA family protein [Pseudomonas sp. RW10S2]MBC3466685.1 DsbA family protein [Pseudomonas sp. RW10S2]